MDRKSLLGRFVFLCLLMLCAGSAPVRADHAPPTTATELIGDFTAFVYDFNQWNANEHNEPLLWLELTPAEEQGDMFFCSFCCGWKDVSLVCR